MEKAFWEAMRAKPYASITVGEIARRAGLNRNAVYYHFKNLDDLARHAVAAMLEEEVPQTALKVFEQGGDAFLFLFASEATAQRFDRVWLIVGPHGTPELVRMLQRAIRGVWGRTLGIDLSRVSPETSLVLEFVAGGLTAVMSRQASHLDEPIMEKYVSSRFAHDVFASAIRALQKERAAQSSV